MGFFSSLYYSILEVECALQIFCVLIMYHEGKPVVRSIQLEAIGPIGRRLAEVGARA